MKTAVSFALVLLATVGCADSTKAKLIGTWEIKTEPKQQSESEKKVRAAFPNLAKSMPVVLVLAEDGSCSFGVWFAASQNEIVN